MAVVSNMQPNYRLPFPETVEKRVARLTGKYAHENFPETRYAIDFALNAGVPIIAARSGKVVVAKHDSDRSIHDIKEFDYMSLEEMLENAAKHTNYVCIYHEDGTFAEYLHLDSQQVIEVKQKVEQGQIIGYSGNSGTIEPHLHFNVFKIEDGKAVSIPFEFIEPEKGGEGK